MIDRRTAMLAAPSLLLARPAWAEDELKIAIGQRGNWENSVSELGQDAGFFRKQGLRLEILYTEGSGQTQQAVISGSVDIGIGVGTYGAMGAFAKGAPIRVIGVSMNGAHDLYWYVPAASPVTGMKDAAGRTVAYSTAGSASNLVVLGMQRVLGVALKPVATGGPAATFTQVMSGQVEVGWASPPFGVESADQGRTRIVARGSEVPEFAGQTVRVMVAHAGALARRQDAIARYMRAYREALDWLYAEPAALDAYAKWAGTTPALARRVRDEFYPKANMLPDGIIGLDAVTRDAVTYKYLAAPLTADQAKTLVQLQPR